jgi:hypothetical protein
MLSILLISCALAQPAAPDARPTAQPTTEPTAVKGREPAPLTEFAKANLTDNVIGRGIGAYYTSQRLMDWVIEANPADAEAVAKVRQQWDSEVKPGYEALLKLMGKRLFMEPEAAFESFKPDLDKKLATLKSQLKPSDFHEMVTEGRLEVRGQPSEISSFWYMFDPARGDDDMVLVSAGKVRTVKAQLTESGGKDAGVEFSIPLSWQVLRDKPGLFVAGENGGVGPLIINVLTTQLAAGVEADPVKLAAAAAATPEEPSPGVKETTLLGRPAGRASKYLVSPSGKNRVCGLYQFTVTVNDGKLNSAMVTVGASSKPGERDYTREELAAYL